MRFTQIVSLFLTLAVPFTSYAQQSAKSMPNSQAMEGTVIAVAGTKYWSGFKIESGGKEYTFVTQFKAKQGTNPVVVGGKCCEIGARVEVMYTGSPDRPMLNVTRIVVLEPNVGSQFMPSDGGVILVAVPTVISPSAMRDVATVFLNYRYEADIKAPPGAATKAEGKERNAAVQAHFKLDRSRELLDRTISSPDKKRVVAIYHRMGDVQSEYRIDMYLPNGKLLKKLTPDTMAVHFPDTITWSPDSTTLAFVATIRAGWNNTGFNSFASPTDKPVDPWTTPTGTPTFRTEQIYLCNADGGDLTAVTQDESLIYFYYVWSPNSTMLAVLAASTREWKFLDIVAASKGEQLVPLGRLRIIEKKGRERRLDDNLTSVWPVWAPDSAKVAAAFDTQVRIYDANGINPTQAAMPLRNQLLISSQAYDRDQQRKLLTSSARVQRHEPQDSNAVLLPVQPIAPATGAQEKVLANLPDLTEAEIRAANLSMEMYGTFPDGDGYNAWVKGGLPPVGAPNSVVTIDPNEGSPDERLLVSYNPIVTLAWAADDRLFLKTAYIRRMKNAAHNVESFSRWHRLSLTSRAAAPAR